MDGYTITIPTTTTLPSGNIIITSTHPLPASGTITISANPVASQSGQVAIWNGSGWGWFYPGQTTTIIGNGGASSENTAEKVEAKSKGCSCKKCDTYDEYFEANQKDGTFICWSCRRT